MKTRAGTNGKRALSALLCLVMLFSLLPTFAAPARAAEANEDGFVSLGSKTWTGAEIAGWTNDESMDGKLYAKVGNNYFSVTATNDVYYPEVSGSSLAVTSSTFPCVGYTHSYSLNLNDSASHTYYAQWSDYYVYYNSEFQQLSYYYREVSSWGGDYKRIVPYYIDENNNGVFLNDGSYYSDSYSYGWWYTSKSGNNSIYLSAFPGGKLYTKATSTEYNHITYGSEEIYEPQSNSASYTGELFYKIASADAAGLVANKTLTKQEDGTYSIQLESYVTGGEEPVPMDFILVLEQTNSMATKDATGGFISGGTSWTVPQGVSATSMPSWFYLDETTGKYYKVQREQGYFYEKKVDPKIAGTGGMMESPNDQWGSKSYGNESGYAVLVDGKYEDLYYDTYGANLRYEIKFYYTNAQGKKIYLDEGTTHTDSSFGSYYIYTRSTATAGMGNVNSSDNFSGTVYKKTSSSNSKTYNRLFYVDASGVKHYLGSVAEKESSVVYDKVLYVPDTNTNIPRVVALRDAVNSFVQDLEAQTKADGSTVDHRVAIVGYSMSGRHNTEILTSDKLVSVETKKSSLSGSSYYFDQGSSSTYVLEKNGPQYFDADKNYPSQVTNSDYAKALANLSTSEGRALAENAANALTAYGATACADEGLTMALNIAKNREDTSRPLVVVIFSDGAPGANTDTSANAHYYQASKAVQTAAKIESTYGAKIYSIGMLDVDSAGDKGENFKLKKSTGSTSDRTTKDFLDRVSSNYGDASKTLENPGASTSSAYYQRVDYTEVALMEAFSNIAGTVQREVKSSSNLNSSAVLKDYISENLNLPADFSGSVSAYTVACSGVDENGDYAFGGAQTPVTSGITVDAASKSVSVTGFDYQSNFVYSDGTSARGQKLVVTITGLTPAQYGQDLPSNNEDLSGIYANGSAAAPILCFEQQYFSEESPAEDGALNGYKSLSDRRDDGSYDLTIDSWATGSVHGTTTTGGSSGTTTEKTTTTKVNVPMDIVLVVDQSASMATKDMETSAGETKYHVAGNGKSTWTAAEITDGTTYYCKVGDDYYPVYTESGNLYSGPKSVRGSNMFGYGHDGFSIGLNGAPVYYNVPTSYYVLYNGEMHKIFAITAGLDLHYGLYPYIYTDESASASYVNKAQWSTNTYWIAVFSPWSATKLRTGNSTWNTLTKSGAAKSEVSFINTSGQPLGSTDANGNSAKLSYSWLASSGYISNVYTVSDSGAATKLYYLDASGNKVYIANTRNLSSDNFTLDSAKTDGKLYTIEKSMTRVEALQNVVSTFAAAVAENSADHRIAVVGFAGNKLPSGSSGQTAVDGTSTEYDYTDTGVFINGEFVNYGTVKSYKQTSDRYINLHYYVNAGNNVYQPVRYDYSGGYWYNVATGATVSSSTTFYEPVYEMLDSDDYSAALVNAKQANDTKSYDADGRQLDETKGNGVNDSIDTAISEFGYYGGTYTSYGLAMANQILDAAGSRTGSKTVTTVTKVDGVETSRNEERTEIPGKKIIVVFTDGEPGGNGYEDAIANEALAEAVVSKTQNGATVYTVGLYPNDVSAQVESFMRQLSSEYTADLTDATASNPSNLAVKTSLNGGTTYYYQDDNGKYYSVSATRNGGSSLGWWQHNGNSYTLLTVKGKNGGGSDVLYDDSGNSVYGENASTSSRYWNSSNKSTRKPVYYEYRWYDSDRVIIIPESQNHYEGLSDEDYTQLFAITGQTGNTDGEQYYYKATDFGSLSNAFTKVANSLTSSNTETTKTVTESSDATTTDLVYNGTNSKVQDTISASFEVPANATVAVQVVESDGYTGTYNVNGETIGKPNEGTIHDVIAATTEASASGSYDGMTINMVRSGKTVTVTGFDFGKYYISPTGKQSGLILRVVVSGLQPTASGTLYSNVPAKSAIYTTDSDPEVIFQYNNPSVIVSDYTVTWKNGDDVLETDTGVKFNTAPSYDGAEPSKAQVIENIDGGKVRTTTYTFVGWSKNPDAQSGDADVISPAQLEEQRITADTTYYAVFSTSSVDAQETYTVNWINRGGVNLETDHNVARDAVPEYNNDDPTKEGYIFVGWSTDADAIIAVDASGNPTGALPANFTNAPSQTVAYYDTDGDGIVNFYAVYVAMGELTVKTKTVVVDYSTQNEIAKDVYDFNVASNPSGTFTKTMNEGSEELGTLYFTPKLEQTGDHTYDLTALGDVNVAHYYTGNPSTAVMQPRTLWTVNVVASSSVYIDDSLTEVTTDQKADGTLDYEASLAGVNDTADDAEKIAKGTTLTFTFSGTRIDVYCTSDPTSNSVYTTLKNEDGTDVYVNGEKVKAQIINNKLVNGGTMYNTPTVSYSGLESGKTYVLTVRALTEDYRFDGVRVYGAVTDESYYADAEKNAVYTKVRDLLISANAFGSYDSEGVSFTGAVFVDHFNREGNDGSLPEIGDYTTLGPKNEVYLAKKQGVVFRVDTSAYTNAQVMVGLSVRSATENGTEVLVSNGNALKKLYLNNVTDLYYAVTPSDSGMVVIMNNSDEDMLVAVSNIKVSGTLSAQTPANAAQPSFVMEPSAVSSYLASFNTLEVVEDVDPVIEEPDPEPEPDPDPEPDPTPTPKPTVRDTARQAITSFFNRLLSGLAKLFG